VSDSVTVSQIAAAKYLVELESIPSYNFPGADAVKSYGPSWLSGLDFERGTLLLPIVREAGGADDLLLYRSILRHVGLSKPQWALSTPSGRSAALSKMSVNEVQVFSVAGLLYSTDQDVVDWWDSIARMIRESRDEDKLAAGREAERWCYLSEKNKAPYSSLVRWVALEDNAAGYDIESAVLADGGIQPVYIEVKRVSQEGEIILTRGEWDFALANPTNWQLQCWRTVDQMASYSVSDVARHIPLDTGGCWLQVRMFPGNGND
jgi:hypothetical protein